MPLPYPYIPLQDQLGQDMFLVGPPGPLRRNLALSFCELTGKEVECVSLSRDTTETDLKQRREIVGGTVHYLDQVRTMYVCYCNCVVLLLCTYVTICTGMCVCVCLCVYMYVCGCSCEVNVRTCGNYVQI